MLSKEDQRTVAGRARTLLERLDGPAPADASTEGPDRPVEEYVEEWRQHVAGGDEEVFQRRLDQLGLDLEECRRRMAATTWPEDEPLPDWVAELDDVLAFVGDGPHGEPEFEPAGVLPFEELVVPVTRYARTKLDEEATELVSREAILDLSARLGERLVDVWSRALFVDFQAHLASHDPDLVFDDEVEPPEGSTEYYDEFVQGLLDGEFRSFFREYSYLGRMVVTLVRQWTANVEEFCRRLDDDRESLAATFAEGETLGAVTAVDAVGDAHQRGRKVLGVTFEDGTTVAYKPRNAGLVTGFYDLLDWINSTGDLPDLRTLDFVRRDDYAWMEWVEPGPCESESEVREYYRRAGMFVCLFYAFDAVDMHLENIIATGEQPVAIDLETLAQPMVRPEFRMITEMVRVVADTIIRTGAVPRHTPGSQLDDLSAFAGHSQEESVEVDRFEDTNTDRMELTKAPFSGPEAANLPELDGGVAVPEDNYEEIVRGFEEMYRFVLGHRAELLAEDGPIETMTDRKARVRLLYRNTTVYNGIVSAVWTASNQRSGLDFGVRAEALAKLVVDGSVDETAMQLVEVERDVLVHMNTPRFTAELDSRDVFDRNDVVVEDFMERTPLAQVRERIRSFSEDDLQEQLDYIRWGYGSYRDPHTSHGTSPVSPSSAEGSDVTSADVERVAADAARDVFRRLADHARVEEEGTTWIRREIEPRNGVYVHRVHDDLYAGRVGIGLFAAGLAHALGGERFRQLADDAVEPMLDALAANDFEHEPGLGRYSPRSVGGVQGLGSIVYGLTRMGALLDDDRYVRAAGDVAEVVRPERIEADERYDVLHGSAGAILGLLPLYEATGDDDVLDRAVRCGEHLLANRDDGREVPTWTLPEFERPLCGFSHGTAGIAYALSRLGDATGESRFGATAAESLRHERRLFDEDRANWPDLRPTAETEWVDAWCHGRTGVGLARLGMLGAGSNGDVRSDLDRALDGVDRSVLPSVDHVCCGTFGRVEFLLEAGRRLDEPTYVREAERLAAASADRASSEGRFSTHWQTDQWYNPSMFDGEAGVGYGMLRLVDESLPSVLLLE